MINIQSESLSTHTQLMDRHCLEDTHIHAHTHTHTHTKQLDILTTGWLNKLLACSGEFHRHTRTHTHTHTQTHTHTHTHTNSPDLLCVIESMWHASYPQNTPIHRLITVLYIPWAWLCVHACCWTCLCMSTTHFVCESNGMHTKYCICVAVCVCVTLNRHSAGLLNNLSV